jgi:hypothetical protein
VAVVGDKMRVRSLQQCIHFVIALIEEEEKEEEEEAEKASRR